MKAIPYARPNHTDWIFFSSKHAVKYFFEGKPDIGKAKIGVIGKATSVALRQQGKRADFIGYSTDTKLTGKQFASLVKSGTVLFPQAKDSMRTVQQQFVNKYQVKDLVVYETIQKPVTDVPEADIMLFTSPSNVEAYLEKNGTISRTKNYCHGRCNCTYIKVRRSKFGLPRSRFR